VARAIIAYDKDLPEIPERLGQAHLPPAAHLRKKRDAKDEFEIVDGRRPSRLLLVNHLRDAVGAWRAADYPAASAVTRRLFDYWFGEDHEVGGKVFHYYFGQREAMETLAYLVDVLANHDVRDLVNSYGEVFTPEGSQGILSGTGLIHETTVSGKRRVRRYIPELQSETIQDLPAENLRRWSLKMATGSGKTAVMAMVAVWSYFHKQRVEGSDLSTNFLILAPNVIVFQRLEKDFGDNQIFRDLPLIPPEWRGSWNLKVILREEAIEPGPSGNLFLVNIDQMRSSEDDEWTPANAIDALLGRGPVGNPVTKARSMLERVRSLDELVVMNDEAHHVHDEDLRWHQTLMDLHGTLPSGLALWLDFSATPKDQNGTYFPWVICDYPLAQAVEDRIVKAPLIVHRVERADPDNITQDNVADVYGDWLLAALTRWREHYETYRRLGPKPVLFIMTEKNVYADAIGRWLWETRETKLTESDVLIIHTDSEGRITPKSLERARKAARDLDLPSNKVKVVVSVMMLREGWDVRNVTVVLGLRPFTSKARILPEQAVGRGLRLMEGISPDRTQTLEVMGTEAFEGFVRQLETEGVGIRTVTQAPPPPVKVEPVRDKIACDITIPMTQPAYKRDYKKLRDLDPLALEPIYNREELEDPLRIRLQMIFATTETSVGLVDVDYSALPPPEELLASITRKTVAEARLTAEFAALYPIVQTYVAERCFGERIDLEGEVVRGHLRSALVQQAIAKYLASEIGRLTAEVYPLELERRRLRLSDTREFTWRRNLPLLSCEKTLFNLVATYNDFEKEFAGFLNQAPDVLRFASLGTTEQDSGANFRVNYLKPSGALGFYYPDWVVVQTAESGEMNWIVETKGRVWEDTLAKDAAIRYWCGQVSALAGEPWRFLRVNQSEFKVAHPSSFSDLPLPA
jgi:type III restriction enzyme